MFRRVAGWLVGLTGFFSFLYVFYFVELGSRTAYEHIGRILATEPAQEFKEELGQAGAALGERIKETVQPADAGAAPIPE